jgi:hypothetical protein
MQRELRPEYFVTISTEISTEMPKFAAVDPAAIERLGPLLRRGSRLSLRLLADRKVLKPARNRLRYFSIEQQMPIDDL